MRLTSLRLLPVFLLLFRQAAAETPHPEITYILPGAVQRGTTSEVTVVARQARRGFETASQVFFGGTGLSAEVSPLEKKAPVERRKLKVTAAPDAPLGLREVRVATGNGISSLGELLVVDDPVIVETSQPHGTQATAQPVEINRVVAGAIAAKEEVDLYRFRARAGQEVTFSLMGQRLYFKRHYQEGGNSDPMLVLTDPSGEELAANDDHDFGDPLLHHRFEKDGEYILAVRDVDYAGAPHFTYSLAMTDRPFVTAVYPVAIPKDGPWTACASGYGLPDGPLRLSGLTSPAPAGSCVAQLIANGVATNAATFEVTDLPIHSEVEPNDDRGRATPVPRIGVVLSGRVDRPGDVDHFDVTLKAGQPVRFEVKARRAGSGLDSNLRLIDEKGTVVASGDDARGSKDASLTFRPTSAGRYSLEIRDLLHRGGPSYAYCIEAVEDEPDFEVACDDDRAGVGPGGAVPWFLRATRRAGFDGPIEVRVEGLPQGLSARPVTILSAMTDSCIILQAAPDAKPAAAAVKVMASAQVKGLDGKTRKVEHRVQPLQELYMGGGGRSVWPVETQIAQVVTTDDIAAVRVSPSKIALKPGEQTTLDVEVCRRSNFKGRVTLDVQLQHLGSVYGNSLPPGVTLVEAGSKTSLAPEESRGRIILKAAPDAKPVEGVSIAVVAFVSIDFVVKRAYASAPIPTTVGAAAIGRGPAPR
ncbi:MAG: PPC domain-containing protein [Isosphaeraceae bacterium]